MNNDQYSNMMVAFSMLEAKIEKLEKLLQPNPVVNNAVVEGGFGEKKPFTALREVKDACN
ncbi:MAG: hypothetical protein Tp178MES00d2C33159851_82 [Prokaryotic dsDNA virus sp.]|nr:MAG: hypothetical protein Tp178MES00d2C33159851_82 [Prokaryotic dsDNA virus sp.]|tara:strand:- start:54693 stop:54872 length:180 start_codon:yes stop_codon:yes gene_type:complete